MNFEAFIKEIEENQWKVYGVEAYRDGKLVSSWGDTKNKYPIYSVAKTLVSIAAGIAWDRGRLDLNKSVLEYLPENFVAEMSEKQRETFGELSLHRLMTMSVKGFPFRAEGESWLRFSLACPIENPREKVFDYSNIPAYLTGIAVSQAMQEDGWSFISRNILEPLSITGAEYSRCPDGFFYGASGMKLSVNDVSKIGLMLGNGGTYAGRRIVSEEYVRMATSVQQMNREGGYGYYLWKFRDGFSLHGKWKQKCYVLPKEGLMVTFLSDIRDDSDDLIRSCMQNMF